MTTRVLVRMVPEVVVLPDPEAVDLPPALDWKPLGVMPAFFNVAVVDDERIEQQHVEFEARCGFDDLVAWMRGRLKDVGSSEPLPESVEWRRSFVHAVADFIEAARP